MIFEGFKQAFIGMGVVLLFLSLMILLIQWVASLTRESSRRELAAIKQAKDLRTRTQKVTQDRQAQAVDSEDSGLDIAVIAAAVAAYEEERFQLRT